MRARRPRSGNAIRSLFQPRNFTRLRTTSPKEIQQLMQTNSRFQRPMFFGLIFSLLLTIGIAMPAAAQEKSLYQRVGGYDALAAVVDDFITRLVTENTFA